MSNNNEQEVSLDSVLTSIANSSKDAIDLTTTSIISTVVDGNDCYTTASPFAMAQKIKEELKSSNFKMCAEINRLVGNVERRSITTAKQQLKIIEGEWNEMCQSVDKGDLETLRDDIADVLFTVYGMAARLGYPADLDFEEVCKSQYSKFDNSHAEARQTHDKYLELGIETHYLEQTKNDGQVVFVTYSTTDQTGKDGKFYPGGKWLKSVNFKEPTFKPLD